MKKTDPTRNWRTGSNDDARGDGNGMEGRTKRMQES